MSVSEAQTGGSAGHSGSVLACAAASELGGPSPTASPCGMCTNATVNLFPSRTAEKQFDCHLQGDTKGVLWLSQKGKLRLRERA